MATRTMPSAPPTKPAPMPSSHTTAQSIQVSMGVCTPARLNNNSPTKLSSTGKRLRSSPDSSSENHAPNIMMTCEEISADLGGSKCDRSPCAVQPDMKRRAISQVQHETWTPINKDAAPTFFSVEAPSVMFENMLASASSPREPFSCLAASATINTNNSIINFCPDKVLGLSGSVICAVPALQVPTSMMQTAHMPVAVQAFQKTIGPLQSEEKPRMTMEERQKNKFKRQEEVMQAIGEGNVTEKCILDNVGDSRYTREILRRLLAQGVVQRTGKGGSNDPFLYTLVHEMLDQDGKTIAAPVLVDPGLEVRLKRIETKISAQLSQVPDFTTEKAIRELVGDNTGTGKALRRLVASGRVVRIGKGGVSDPYRYKYNHSFVAPAAPAGVAVPSGAQPGGRRGSQARNAIVVYKDDAQALRETSRLRSPSSGNKSLNESIRSTNSNSPGSTYLCAPAANTSHTMMPSPQQYWPMAKILSTPTGPDRPRTSGQASSTRRVSPRLLDSLGVNSSAGKNSSPGINFGSPEGVQQNLNGESPQLAGANWLNNFDFPVTYSEIAGDAGDEMGLYVGISDELSSSRPNTSCSHHAESPQLSTALAIKSTSNMEDAFFAASFLESPSSAPPPPLPGGPRPTP